MNILTDLHTHTLASDHAYSTLKENADAALERGLEMLAITDHCVALSDSPHPWHFSCHKVLPRYIGGMMLLFGVECNFMDIDGSIDLEERYLENLDIVLAGVHDQFIPRDRAQNTQVLLNALNNRYIDILCHPERNMHGFDYDAVAIAARDAGKIIEINNHSFHFSNVIQRCEESALAYKKHGTPVVVNTDAHCCYDVGIFDEALRMLKRIDFPEELIVNRNRETFIRYMSNRDRGFKN